MTNAPLTVRIVTPTEDRIIPSDLVSGLRWTKSAQGGWRLGSCRLAIGRDDLRIPELSYIQCSDRRTGRVVMDGYCDEPGRGYGGVQGYDLTFSGGATLLEYVRRVLLYIDRTTDAWVEDANTSGNRYIGGSYSTTMPGETDRAAVVVQFPQGVVVQNKFVAMSHAGLASSDMRLGAYSFSSKAGLSSTDWVMQTATTGGGVVNRNAATSYGAQSSTSATFGTAVTWLRVGLHRTGANTNVANDTAWAGFADMLVKGLLLRSDGTVLPGITTTPYWYPHQIVADLLGRMLPLLDGPSALIDESTAQVSQLVYAEGAHAGQVLSDLTLYEPDAFPYVGARSDATSGGHAFRYARWPALDDPRLELTEADGVDISGREGGTRANRILVTWDADGRRQSRIVTIADDVLDRAGITRDAESIALPDGQGSYDNAALIGAQVLTQRNSGGVNGTCVIARPVRDLHTGRTWMPWEHEADCVARLRDTGETARVTEVSFDDEASDGPSATLTLGQPVRTQEQLLAGLPRQRHGASS